MSEATEEPKAHVARVQELLEAVCVELRRRGRDHDRSKLLSPEVEVFEEFTGKLRGCTYGSEEYRGYLEAMRPALVHHYRENEHHPEHFAFGVADMSLLVLIEMFCDWKAASERHADGDLVRSIEVNTPRFGITKQVVQILKATASGMRGW